MAELGHCEIITTLLHLGYGVNEIYAGNKPIHCSAMRGQPAAAKLPEYGADIKAINEDAKTPFQEAIWSPNKISIEKEVELKFAIEARVVSTLRVLVENGAYNEIFAIDRSGCTPLLHTVEVGFSSEHDIRVGTAVLRFLIEQEVK